MKKTKANLKKKDYQSPQKETHKFSNSPKDFPLPEQIWNEIDDMNQNQAHYQHQQPVKEIQMLQKILEVQQNEIQDYQGDLPTSLLFAEKEVVKYISECLQDDSASINDISCIPTLVRDYKVVSPVRGQIPSVSLRKIHLILQDNYKDSSLCKLFNLLLGCSKILQTKVITFM